MFVVGFYFITFIVTAVVIGMNLFRNKKTDSMLILLEIVVMINVSGRFFLSVSDNLEMAIWFNKYFYIGAIYGILLLVIMTAQMCNIKLPKWLIVFFTVAATFVYAMVLTIGHSDIYYKTVSLGYQDGYYYLEKTYGPVHAIYPMLVIMYVLTLLGIAVVAIYKRKEIPAKTVILIAGLGVTAMLSYFVTRFVGSNVEWVTVVCLISVILLAFWSDKIEMFDMTNNIAGTLEQMNEYGYIAFDKKLRYVRANNFAQEVFLEIKQWNSEEKVSYEDSVVYKEIVGKLQVLAEEKEPKILQVNDRFVNVSVRDIIFHNKKVGYLVEIIDKTLEHMYLQTVENYNVELENEVKEKTEDILSIKDNMVLGMAVMVEGRDNSTGGHIQRTSAVVRVFVNRLRTNEKYNYLPYKFWDNVIKAAPMHDLGKITVDDRILRKQGKFTDEEYEQMKKHSAEGAKIVERILRGNEDDDFVDIARNIAHFHHEKWNGTGYPDKLKGEEIPLEARIMAFADVYDALVSKRCYKEAFSHEKAMQIIENDIGSHFEADLGEVFLECRAELEALYEDEEFA